MKKEYIEHYSKCLNKQMHLCIYGHAGVTVLGFPTQDSNCHNYEDFGIIYHLSDFIEPVSYTHLAKILCFCLILLVQGL